MYVLYFYFIFDWNYEVNDQLFAHPNIYKKLRIMIVNDLYRIFVGAKVVKVYDGDTITVACKYPKRGNQLYRFSVRLAGIDAPEMNADSFIERVEANISKNELHRLVFNETVKLKISKLKNMADC